MNLGRSFAFPASIFCCNPRSACLLLGLKPRGSLSNHDGIIPTAHDYPNNGSTSVTKQANVSGRTQPIT